MNRPIFVFLAVLNILSQNSYGVTLKNCAIRPYFRIGETVLGNGKLYGVGNKADEKEVYGKVHFSARRKGSTQTGIVTGLGRESGSIKVDGLTYHKSQFCHYEQTNQVQFAGHTYRKGGDVIARSSHEGARSPKSAWNGQYETLKIYDLSSNGYVYAGFPRAKRWIHVSKLRGTWKSVQGRFVSKYGFYRKGCLVKQVIYSGENRVGTKLHVAYRIGEISRYSPHLRLEHPGNVNSEAPSGLVEMRYWRPVPGQSGPCAYKGRVPRLKVRPRDYGASC